MKNTLAITLSLLFSCIIWTGCSNSTLPNEEINTSWVFVANEGNFGASNGSISMIDDRGFVHETEAIGDVVQSLEVYEDKLIVLINNSHMIKVYDIVSEGIAMPGIAIQTNGSSPREMVIIDGMVYFTNWNTSDVKVFNLHTYNIENSIPVGVMPEGIITDGIKLWVANSGEDTVHEIDIISNTVTAIYTVGQGPQNLVHHNGNIYISRTYYNENWATTYHGTSRIGTEVLINNYGSGGPCGGSILSHQSNIYRSFNGGLSQLDSDLNLLEEGMIGEFNQSNVYHIDKINGNFWFTLTNFEDHNEIKVVSPQGIELLSYKVGLFPGDLAYWEKSD